jgi:hypothetical protein
MANAAVELTEGDHPARNFVAEFKRSQRDRLAKICHDAGIENADTLANTLSLLQEGALVSRQSMGADGLSSGFVAAGEAVIASFAGASAAVPAAPKKKIGKR